MEIKLEQRNQTCIHDIISYDKDDKHFQYKKGISYTENEFRVFNLLYTGKVETDIPLNYNGCYGVIHLFGYMKSGYLQDDMQCSIQSDVPDFKIPRYILVHLLDLSSPLLWRPKGQFRN